MPKQTSPADSKPSQAKRSRAARSQRSGPTRRSRQRREVRGSSRSPRSWRFWLPVSGAALFVLAGVGLWVLRWQSGYNANAQYNQDVDVAIEAARDYLVSKINKQGRFVYEYPPDGRIDASRYNILRHSGTLYALGELHRFSPGPKVAQALMRGAAYLQADYVRPLANYPGAQAVFSKPGEETSRRKPPRAKLGGAGLAMVGLNEARRLDERAVELSTLAGLATFVTIMQREDGGYHSRFTERDGFDTSWNSLYYPGEAMLGLVRLYNLDGNERWLLSAARAAQYLVESREGQSPPRDHWMMISGAELVPLMKKLSTPPISQDLVVEHLEKIARKIIGTQLRTWLPNPTLEGAFSPDGGTSNAGTMVEGLLALERLWRATGRSGGALEDKVRRSARDGVKYLMRVQILEGDRRGGFPNGFGLPKVVDEVAKTKQATVRIDNVQHALSALIAYRRQICGNAARCIAP